MTDEELAQQMGVTVEWIERKRAYTLQTLDAFFNRIMTDLKRDTDETTD